MAAWFSGGVQLLGVVSSLVFLEGPCAGGVEMRRVPLRPRIPKPGEGEGAERRRWRGGLSQEVAEESSGGRVSRCPGEGLAVRRRTPMGGTGGDGRCWRRLCAHPGGRGQPRPHPAVAPPPPRGRPAPDPARSLTLSVASRPAVSRAGVVQ